MSSRLLLEISPSSCILLIGPHLTSSLLSTASVARVLLSHHSLLCDGIQRIGRIVGSREEQRLVQLLACDPGAANREIVSILAAHGEQEEWLRVCLSESQSLTPLETEGPLLQLLTSFQARGCRLVYTYYDTILGTLLGSSPVLPIGDALTLEQWIEGQMSRLLHINGVYHNTNSLILQPGCYNNRFINVPGLSMLRDLFRSRTVVCVGHDPDHMNPLLTELIHYFLEEDNLIKNPPVYLTSSQLSLPSCFLHLPITKAEESSELHHIIGIGEENDFTSGESMTQFCCLHCITK